MQPVGRWRPALIVCALLLSACGTSTIRPGAAAQSVAQFVSQKTGFHPNDVKCPSGVPAKVGGTFDCHFTGPDAKYVAHVSIRGVHGQRVDQFIVTRPVPGTTTHRTLGVLATEQTVTHFVLTHTRFRPADVRCPPAIPARVGVAFDCGFTGPDGRYAAHVTVTGIHGASATNRIVTRKVAS